MAEGRPALMSVLRKRKFFEEANKIYSLKAYNAARSADLFDFLLAQGGRPDAAFTEMATDDEIVPETRSDTEPATIHEALLKPTVSVVESDIVPETKSQSSSHFTESESHHESSSSSYAPSVTFASAHDQSLNSSTFSCATLDESFAAFPAAHPPTPTPTPTTLPSPTPLTQQPELAPLVDYYDTDHYTELLPCYLFYATQCNLHDTHLSHPHLLFCVQVLDQFLSSVPSMHSYVRRACQVARVVFANRWTKRHDAHPKDVDFADYTERGRTLPGVCDLVWDIVLAHWRRYKAHVLHSDEFFLGGESALPETDCRHLPRHYFASTDRWLEAQAGKNAYGGTVVGAQYLQSLPNDGCNRRPAAQGLAQRMYLPQESLSFAFKQLEANLRGCDPHVMMYPMGTFARGGLYGSVLDVLLLPTPALASIDAVVAALERAHVLEPRTDRSAAPHRLIAPIRFKHVVLLLDLKLYPPPMAFAAMVYFTGPEVHAQQAFRSVLPACLEDTRFETLYEKLRDMHGTEALDAIADEQDMCVLLGLSVYQHPRHRL
ncbi:hypothetical protein ACHHYP_05378 [Achlya hypogyna]|uniref:Uncharacterized protein n=1 Tax=Achlya hypogyna TaxID=1202772 RepID=A0A1V9YXZ7_ACHHY|nr:hypothetical protein ACHHYP_05378 [Achlya hypogyna]